jgi:hypothetical protein
MKSPDSSATRLGPTEGHALALSACAEFGPPWLTQFVGRLRVGSVLTVVMALFLTTNRVAAHTHVEIIYRENQLELIYYDYDYGESDPAHVQIAVDAAAARALSEHSAFLPWLGEGGATVWLLPQTEDPRLIWLGVGSAGVPADHFVGPLELRLQSVEGPGHFALFFTDSFGQPMRQMSSRDGIGSDDVMSVPARSHIHCNWEPDLIDHLGRQLTVVTGFLGSGKTTLLNHALTRHHGRRIAVIENEFGEIGIDHELVVKADEEIFEMNNGCICCTVRGDLIRLGRPGRRAKG